MNVQKDFFLEKPFFRSGKNIFLLFWVVTFVLYLPDFKAGWVLDAPAWLYYVKHQGFWDYVNRTQSKAESLYQFTQFITLVFYKLFGQNVWLWSLLYVTLQAINGALLFQFFTRLFKDASVKNAGLITLSGIFLFLLSPYISEVIIWKACYHYLQGMLFLVAILLCVQSYFHQQHNKYLIIACAVFVLSMFSLEIFYTTPFFALSLALYYRYSLNRSHAAFKKIVTLLVIPEILLFGLYFVLMKLMYHHIQPHVYNIFSQSLITYFSKPIRYIIHLLFFGRFFSIHAKQHIYDLCSNPAVLVACYAAIVLLVIMLFRNSKNKPASAITLLLLGFSVFSIAILVPLPFPGPELLVFYDSYAYFAAAFCYMLLAYWLITFINKKISILIISAFAITGLYFTIKLNQYWKHSAYINNRLLTELPPANNKITILLDLPECMNGVPMMGADPDGEYKQLQQILYNDTSSRKIYDAASFNMMTTHDAAHVRVLNDSTVKVTLNQWGTWWFYEGHGGRSYETSDYRLNMTDVGHEYELTLKHPNSNYLVLFQSECAWRTVDWAKKDQDQY